MDEQQKRKDTKIWRGHHNSLTPITAGPVVLLVLITTFSTLVFEPSYFLLSDLIGLYPVLATASQTLTFSSLQLFSGGVSRYARLHSFSVSSLTMYIYMFQCSVGSVKYQLNNEVELKLPNLLTFFADVSSEGPSSEKIASRK